MAVGVIVSDTDREWMAELMTAQMRDVCSVSRPTVTKGTSGGSRPGYADTYAGLPCSFVSKLRSGDAERTTGGVVEAYIDGTMRLPLEWDGSPVEILAKDRIVMAARGGRGAKTFEVVTPGDDSVGLIQSCSVVKKSV